jgi:Ca2+-binding RTX toxin-like protein
MRLRSDRATRYELKFEAGDATAPQLNTYTFPVKLPSAGSADTLSTMPKYAGTAATGTSTWFEFTTTHDGRGREGLGLTVTSGPNALLELNRVTFVGGVAQPPVVLQSVVAGVGASAAINFEGLPVGTYRVRVSLAPGVTGTASYALSSFTAPGDVFSYDLAAPVETKNAPPAPQARRDVYLGGTGNDTIQGGSGEDWIFGGPDNDLLTGGIDRQASDLIFGEGGDDRFQAIPDFRTARPDGLGDFDNAGSDLFVGGDGTDRVV